METQNMMKAKQSELWDHYFSFVFSSCHSFVIHFAKVGCLPVPREFRLQPIPHSYPQPWWQYQASYSTQEFFEAVNSTFVQPPLRALFSQFRHSSASLICETATDGVGKIKIDKSSRAIELLLQPKSRKNIRMKREKNKKKFLPAKLKTQKGGLGKN